MYMKRKISISLLLGSLTIALEMLAAAPFPVMMLTLYVAFAYPLLTGEHTSEELSSEEMEGLEIEA